jgi:hypothetical protein
MRLIILCLLLTSACTLNTPSPPAPITETPVPTDWTTITPGLEQRTLIPDEGELAQITVLRIDPNQFRFQVHYRPGDPQTIRAWRDILPTAAVIINANFFDANNNIVGMLISDGIIYGTPYRDRGGMFSVENGLPRVRSNIYTPYNGEPIEQAVQAFPMLVLDGQPAFTRSGAVSRRTAIGQDNLGRIIIMVTPGPGLSLSRFSAVLAQSDLNLINAFALDGGGSSMLDVAASETRIGSFDPVPAVLAVYAR